MTTTLETQPAYIALASSVDYVETSIYGPLLLLGISGDLVSPAIQGKLRRHEAWKAFLTVEAAAGELLKRAEWSIELHGRKAESRARLLSGLDAILATQVPLLEWRDTRQKITDMRDRLALVVERDKTTSRVEVKHVDGDHNWQRVDVLEKEMAKLMETRDRVAQSYAALMQAVEGLNHKLNAR